jgi:hypothetical protein
MSEHKLLLFEKAGKVNTEATLTAAAARAAQLGIDQVVVATTTGATALAASHAMPACKIIGVTLQAGVWDKYAPPDPALIGEAKDRGVEILTATHSLMGNVATAVREKFGGVCPTELIAYVYYTFGQGMKVAVEIAASAADAGLLDMEQEVLAIAGTGEGADTAIVVSPAFTTRFFDTRIREVLCMPR